MGRAIVSVLRETDGAELVAALDAPGSPHLGTDAGVLAGGAASGVSVSDDVGAALGAADVVIDFSLPEGIAPYVVEKGSIAVDGVSLTVAAVTDTMFSIAIIPHTFSVTAMGSRAVGDTVNLEADVLAKYVERLVRPTLDRS